METEFCSSVCWSNGGRKCMDYVRKLQPCCVILVLQLWGKNHLGDLGWTDDNIKICLEAVKYVVVIWLQPTRDIFLLVESPVAIKTGRVSWSADHLQMIKKYRAVFWCSWLISSSVCLSKVSTSTCILHQVAKDSSPLFLSAVATGNHIIHKSFPVSDYIFSHLR
jgi:hypothetical protein